MRNVRPGFVALFALAIGGSILCSAQTGIFEAGKRHLYLHCEGKRNGPVVILSTGLFREASDWRLIMPGIAGFTQVCGYDREGLGKSTVDHDPARPESESTDEKVEDLDFYWFRRASSLPISSSAIRREVF